MSIRKKAESLECGDRGGAFIKLKPDIGQDAKRTNRVSSPSLNKHSHFLLIFLTFYKRSRKIEVLILMAGELGEGGKRPVIKEERTFLELFKKILLWPFKNKII